MKKKVSHFILFSLLLMSSQQGIASDFVWYDGQHAVSYNIASQTDPVVTTAIDMFADDMKAVTGQKAIATKEKEAKICIIELDRASKSVKKSLQRQGVDIQTLAEKTDGFSISVINNQITIVGTNGRGAAYGLLELSRKAGVNPWIWWGDIVPERRQRLVLDSDYKTLQGASVNYRGIFINDEDWSLRTWSIKNFEPASKGQLGPKTYKKVFQLLLRLRANAIWPAMHTGTKAFFKTAGAKQMADSCGIAIGSSHCEPLLRNNVDEWNQKERGAYNYITNKQAVQDYWIERLKEVKGSTGGNMFTIGMRGIHDGSMEGVKTMQEKFDGLQQVINDQQKLIEQYIGDPSKQMQVFVPYKEVLQIYEKGLKVPDYATLMWCDDNYGYMTRLSNEEEQKRSGGGGVYYHLSYWGRPHDYLWLTTTQPGLIYNEMKAAYDHNVRKLWIVNVHDVKVAGYDLELFLDMAWDINSVNGSTLENHYKAWLCRQFGKQAGEKLFPAMREFYRLCGERHPEFMGWNQVELDKKRYNRGMSPVADTEFSMTAFGGELDRYLERYADVVNTVKEAEVLIRPELKDAYYAAIKYPVFAADANARKLLNAQCARQLAKNKQGDNAQFDSHDSVYIASAQSLKAYEDVKNFTTYYNKDMSNGKWDNIMDMKPRDLFVFDAPTLPVSMTENEVAICLKNLPKEEKHPLTTEDAIARNAADYQQASEGVQTIQMLGHSMKAVALPKNGTLSYTFATEKEGDAVLRTALIPTQPNDNGELRFSVSVDGAEPTVYSLKEPFRSERWKLNVLRGQAVRELKLDNLKKGNHTLVIKALDSHIVVDQWMIDYQANRHFYLFPTD